jgi:haloalkane dehalogenase
VHHRDRVARLALLNTVVFKRPSWAVIAFVAASKTPGLRSLLVSGRGLRFAMRLGVSDKDGLGEEVIRAVEEPFKGEAARRALIRSAHGLHPRGFDDIERGLPELGVPVRVVYGEDDRILPDVKRTMAKVAQQVPGAEVTSLPGCGHFLQEDRPAEVGRLLAEFFAP